MVFHFLIAKKGIHNLSCLSTFLIQRLSRLLSLLFLHYCGHRKGTTAKHKSVHLISQDVYDYTT